MQEGETTLDAYGDTPNDITIQHNIGVQIYTNGVWTIDDWQTTYNFNANRMDAQTYYYASTLSSTASVVTLNASHMDGANKKLKYRVWGFMDEEATKGIGANKTAGYSLNRLVLSTDYQYPMLYKEGKATPNTTITHSLGVIPYVDIWTGSTANNHPFRLVTDDQFGIVYGEGGLVQVTDSAITFTNSSYADDEYYYRIYLP